jgi:hypothetical protein
MSAEIYTLPNQKVAADVMLAQVLANIKGIKSAVISIATDDDMQKCYWSNMTTAELAWHLVSIQHELSHRVIHGDP